MASPYEERLHRDWGAARGIDCTDLNNDVVLARAGVEEVAQALATEYKAQWSRDVLNREIEPGREGLLVFCVQGQAWTEVLYHRHRSNERIPSVLGNNWVQALSRRLATHVISYYVSDSVGLIGYHFYGNGQMLEEFNGSNFEDFGEFEEFGEPIVRFRSQFRTLAPDEIKDDWKFVQQFFVEQDAFEPGLEIGYFLGHSLAYNEPLPPRVVVQNSGVTTYFRFDQVATSIPPLERVDYLRLR